MHIKLLSVRRQQLSCVTSCNIVSPPVEICINLSDPKLDVSAIRFTYLNMDGDPNP